jgi:hypothetical protein
MDLRDSDPQLLVQALLGCLMTKGEKIWIKDFTSVLSGLLSVLHRSDRCLLADESSHVISLELYLSGLEDICVSDTMCLNLIVIIKRLYC